MSYCPLIVLHEKNENYCIQENNRPLLFSLLSPSLSANLRLGEFQCFKLFLFKHNCVWVNSRRGETIWKCKRVKIMGGENNPVCSTSFLNRSELRKFISVSYYWLLLQRKLKENSLTISNEQMQSNFKIIKAKIIKGKLK